MKASPGSNIEAIYGRNLQLHLKKLVCVVSTCHCTEAAHVHVAAIPAQNTTAIKLLVSINEIVPKN
jgi:hypothetical protein